MKWLIRLFCKHDWAYKFYGTETHCHCKKCDKREIRSLADMQV